MSENLLQNDDADVTYAPPIPIRAARQGVNIPLRQGLALTGAGMVLFSVPAALLTPTVPLGLLMAVVGVVFVSHNAVWGRQWLEGAFARLPVLEKALPDWSVRVLLGRAKRTTLPGV